MPIEPQAFAYPQTPAHIIASEAEALAVAQELAAEFAQGAGERDATRKLPVEQVERFSQSGLWAITVPRSHGGLGASWHTVAQVIRIIATGDSSLAQYPQNHLSILESLRISGSEQQKATFFAQVLQGARWGNAFSEYGTSHVGEYRTRLRPVEGGFLLAGRKFYATGALLAHVIPVLALDGKDRPVLAIVDRHRAGITVIDDWSGFGQRTTGSGTVVLEDVRVAAHEIVPAYLGVASPSALGPVAQIIQAAIDMGLAEKAIVETVSHLRSIARPWVGSGLESATQDPYTIAAIGDLEIRRRAARASLDVAGHAVDAAARAANAETVAEASLAVATAKVLTTELALSASNRLFELVGTRSTLAERQLDRLWRDARTHTLHDPVRWKFHVVGNAVLNDVAPPLSSWV